MTDQQKDIFRVEMEVRDYELDLQGIVNNAVYFNYLEHARHKFLLSKSIDFEKLFEQGTAAMVIKAEVKYKSSLRSGDQFIVETYTEKKGRFKIIFYQSIRLKGSETLAIEAEITTACIDMATKRPVEMDW
jgi:acyl-CoA thioester hydrolase